MVGPTPRQGDAQARLFELLEELADIIGPAAGGGEFGPGDGPTGAPTLWEFVVVACWVDDDRQDWLTVTPAAGMLTHHVGGLLQAGLVEAEYVPVGGEGDVG